jgi:aminomethyltransferase
VSKVELKKTPLHGEHVGLGAKLVDFGGWEMPVSYTGILDEHRAVRSAAGVFDISHMGQIFVSGPSALPWLNRLLTNNLERLSVGECQYTFLLNPEGGILDDLIVYCTAPESYLLVVNAARSMEDFAWLEKHLHPDVMLLNQSDEFAGMAIQGPKAIQVFDALFEGSYSPPARNQVLTLEIDGKTYHVARTGYTGEDGFELFCPAKVAVDVWREILEQGAKVGIKPCGLGARDTLRLEVCYPLNGSDLSAETTPLEAGLSFFVDFQKPEFVGREKLLAQRASGVSRRLVPFRMVSKSPPPRAHYGVYKEGVKIAETTSGTLSPSLNIGIGMAYVPAEYAKVGEQLEIEIRGGRFPAVVDKKPLFRAGL